MLLDSGKVYVTGYTYPTGFPTKKLFIFFPRKSQCVLALSRRRRAFAVSIAAIASSARQPDDPKSAPAHG